MEMLETGCVAASRATARETRRPGPAVEEVMRGKTVRERWLVLMRHVRGQCPESIMYRVDIADGIIVSCEALQQCLSFGEPADAGTGAEPVFDASWQALEAECRRMGTGRLAELQFIGGRPIRAKTAPQGRRFRYFNNE